MLLGETHEDCSWLSGKNLFTKMTGLAINEPPAFLAYGTFFVGTNSVTRGCASIPATHPDYLPILTKLTHIGIFKSL
jgi:hypothetical protein